MTGTAAAARRFLVLEVSTMADGRPRPDPTEFVVSGPRVTATFPGGPIGQQHALMFTWCGTPT